MIVICLDRGTCPSSVNSELLRISELKNQYKDTLITIKLMKTEGTQGTLANSRNPRNPTESKEPKAS
jgi:hypothetical protein